MNNPACTLDLFEWAECQPTQQSPRRKRVRGGDAVTTGRCDKPSRQVKDWPVGVWFGSEPVVEIKRK